jgi:hypothetical protein
VLGLAPTEHGVRSKYLTRTLKALTGRSGASAFVLCLGFERRAVPGGVSRSRRALRDQGVARPRGDALNARSCRIDRRARARRSCSHTSALHSRQNRHS